MSTINIDTIIQQIGDQAKDDYILQPQKHVEKYKETLPELAGFLEDSAVQHISTEYNDRDKLAGAMQKRFKQYATWARRFTFLAAVFSATLIMAGTLDKAIFMKDAYKDLPLIVLRVSTILTIIFSGATTSMLMIIKNLKLLEKWMKNRASAEEMRLQYFEALVDLQDEKEDTKTSLAVLEYFRRYQLDMQINYYNIRSGELEKESNRSIIIIAIIAGLVIIINGIAGYGALEWAWFATFAVILQAYSALVSNKELSNQSERNAERYESLRRELSKIKARIDDVRMGVLEGNTGVLKKFVKAIHDPMAAEHWQWLETMGVASSAISDLEAELEKINQEEKKA